MSVAYSYANALYEAICDAQQKEQVGQIEAKLSQLAFLLTQSREARIALLSPLATLREKSSIVDEISKQQGFGALETRFIQLLVKKGRLDILSDILESFHSLRLIREGGTPGQITAADPLSDAQVDSLSKVLSKKLGKKVTFRVSVDPSLLAGMKVTVNGVTYDGTLRSQLQKLRDCLVTGLSGSLT